MRPGMRELTTTSFASTVPINCRSLERLVVKKYQQSDMTNNTPRMIRILFRGFMITFSVTETLESPALAWRPVRAWQGALHAPGRQTKRCPGTRPRLCDAFSTHRGQKD